MAGYRLAQWPMSSTQGALGLSSAAIQWIRSRRVRSLAATLVLLILVVALIFSSSSQSIPHPTLSSYRPPAWTSHVPGSHSIESTSFQPSHTTLEIEDGTLPVTPSHLTKATPNFHVLMPALEDNKDFCQATLSGMLLNYPPPTVVSLFQKMKSIEEVEKAKLESILGYLGNTKLVNEEDLVLIADGYDSWFQLPPDVMIRQYESVIADANERLLKRYGHKKGSKEPNLTQAVVFGADKVCEGDEHACRLFPESTLPSNIYGVNTGKEPQLTPAKYLDAGMVMGPARDLRILFEAAISRINDGTIDASNMQTVLTIMFTEQHFAREMLRKATSAGSKFMTWLDDQLGKTHTFPDENITLWEHRNYEFSMGLDYTHSLFQPFDLPAEDELILVTFDNLTNPKKYHHPHTPTPPLTIPIALREAMPPFYTAGPSSEPNPNDRPTYMKSLNPSEKLDALPPPNSPWSSVPLVTNTFTGAIPVLLHARRGGEQKLPEHNLEARATFRGRGNEGLSRPANTNITFSDLWYFPHSRALLRRYLRQPQSAIGFHAAAVGGDRLWDSRGGHGGIWTAKEDSWYGWGQADGVCGTVSQVTEIFADGKGVWLYEEADSAQLQERLKIENDVQAERKKLEAEFQEKLMEEIKKEKGFIEEGLKGMNKEVERRVMVMGKIEVVVDV